MPEDYRVLMEHCWAAEPSSRPSTATLQKCIGLMIADRQHSLGMPVRCSIDLVDQEYGRERGSSDSSTSKAIMQQVAAQFAPQPPLPQQQQQQQLQQHSHRQHMLQRHPTPARLPVIQPQHPQPRQQQPLQQQQQQPSSPPQGVQAPGVRQWHHSHDPLRGEPSPSQPGRLLPHHAPGQQQGQGCNGAVAPGLNATQNQQHPSAGPAAAQAGAAAAAAGVRVAQEPGIDGGDAVVTSQPYIRDL